MLEYHQRTFTLQIAHDWCNTILGRNWQAQMNLSLKHGEKLHNYFISSRPITIWDCAPRAFSILLWPDYGFPVWISHEKTTWQTFFTLVLISLINGLIQSFSDVSPQKVQDRIYSHPCFMPNSGQNPKLWCFHTHAFNLFIVLFCFGAHSNAPRFPNTLASWIDASVDLRPIVLVCSCACKPGVAITTQNFSNFVGRR